MVPGYYWMETSASNQAGSSIQTVQTPAIPSTSCRVTARLMRINHTDAQHSFAADCYISRYVSGGVTHDGHWYALSGQNISQVFCTVSVNGCEALGGFLVEFF